MAEEATDGEYRLTVPISQSLKEQMEVETDDNPVFSSKAAIARAGIDRVLNGEAGSVEVGQLEDDVGEIKAEIGQLRRAVDSIQDAVTDIKLEVEGAPDEVHDLGTEIIEVLPTKPELEQWLKREIPPSRRGDEREKAYAGTVTAIANVLGGSEAEVLRSLRQVRDDTHIVYRMDDTDEPRYYKEV